ncbi:MAG: response regulator transcription factor [Longimicrobiales bacterium]|nr:response regulator transcription factor [Longimicrobiales bacterium]
MAEREQTVFVVDDDAGVLDAVQLLLQSVGLPSRGFSSAGEFLEEFDSDCPGCLILDLRMPGMGGRELQKRLLEMGATLPIIFVTAHGDVPTAVDAVKDGAVDFIQKPFPDQKLLDKVNQALQLDALRKKEREERRAVEARLQTLTPREREVMALVASGKLNKTVARQMGISQRTVEIHRSRVMEKMQATSVPDLVLMILRLDPSDPYGRGG